MKLDEHCKLVDKIEIVKLNDPNDVNLKILEPELPIN
jgi:hypothetical protein